MGKPWCIIHFLAIGTLWCVVGCYTFDKTETVVKTDQTQIECEGPGMEDGVACRLEKCEYKIDDGTRLSVGLFPGMDHRLENKEIGGVGHVINSILNNLFALGIPTIASLCYDPFVADGSNMAKVGLIGVHRWHLNAHEERTKVLLSEKVISLNHNPVVSMKDTQIMRSLDGKPLYPIYPGAERVKGYLKSSDCVDVLHFSGNSIRRFWESALSEHAFKF